MTSLLADVGPAIALIILMVIFGGSLLVVTLMVKLAQIVTRGLFGQSLCFPDRKEAGAATLPCRNKDCRCVNPPGARFCGRCGRPLKGLRGVDRYG